MKLPQFTNFLMHSPLDSIYGYIWWIVGATSEYPASHAFPKSAATAVRSRFASKQEI